MEAEGLGLEEALAAPADAPVKGLGLRAPGGLHAPVGPGSLNRVAQEENQAHAWAGGGDPFQRAGPVDVDGRGLDTHTGPVRKVGGVGGKVWRGSRRVLDVEGVDLLDVGADKGGIVAQIVEQGGGAGLLGADDDEVDGPFRLHWRKASG